MPSPPSLRWRPRSPCTNGSNTRDSSAASMPIPLSATRSRTRFSRISLVISSVPPGPVYLAAFVTTFPTACASRSLSPSTTRSGVASAICSVCCLLAMSGLAISVARATIWDSPSGSFFSSVLPWVRRAASRRSSTRRTKSCTWCWMIARSRAPSSASCCAISSSERTITPSGFRNSCPSIARNEILRPVRLLLALERAAQCQLQLVALCNLVFEGARPLLQQRHLSQPLTFVRTSRVALRRTHVCVEVADAPKVAAVSGLHEVVHRVAAQQRRRLRLQERVPHLLQTDRGFMVSVAPQNVDHLAVQSSLASVGGDPREQIAEGRPEPLPRGHAVDHGIRPALHVRRGRPAARRPRSPRCRRRARSESGGPPRGAAQSRSGRTPGLSRIQSRARIVGEQLAQVRAVIVELNHVAAPSIEPRRRPGRIVSRVRTQRRHPSGSCCLTRSAQGKSYLRAACTPPTALPICGLS